MANEEDLAEYALSISIPRVIQELSERGLPVAGQPEVLRARLTQVIFQEAGLQAIPVEVIRDSENGDTVATSSPLDRVQAASVQDTLITVESFDRVDTSQGAVTKKVENPRLSSFNHNSRSRNRNSVAGPALFRRQLSEMRKQGTFDAIQENPPKNQSWPVSGGLPLGPRSSSTGPGYLASPPRSLRQWLSN